MPSPAGPRLADALFARRDEASRAAHARLRRLDLATSAWTPPALLLAAFAAYLVVVQAWPGSVSWALPAMRAVSSSSLLAILAIALARILLRRFASARRARVEARGLISEVDRLLRRRPGAGEGARLAILEAAAALDAELLSGDPARVEARLDGLAKASERELGPPRRLAALELAATLGAALGAALLVRTFLVEPFRIPSGSMLPTLEIGDQVFVNKLAYGLRIPFTNRVPLSWRAPHKGDVIVFEDPVDGAADLIKRVAGEPGDVVEIVDEGVRVNGVPQPRVLLAAEVMVYDVRRGDWAPSPMALYREELGGVAHAVVHRPSHPSAGRTQGPFVVPPGQVFVLGDNRDASSDSRYGFGKSPNVKYVPFGNIKGKAMAIWLSLSHQGMFSSLFGGTGLRTDRLFVPVR